MEENINEILIAKCIAKFYQYENINDNSLLQAFLEQLFLVHGKSKKIILSFILWFYKLNNKNNFTFEDSYNYSSNLLNKIFIILNEYNYNYSNLEKEKLINLLSIIFYEKSFKFEPFFFQNKIKEQLDNFKYEENTILGFIASELNKNLLRLFLRFGDVISNNFQLFTQTIEKQELFNQWTVNYL